MRSENNKVNLSAAAALSPKMGFYYRLLCLPIWALCISSCSPAQPVTEMNRLTHSSSPYLLQHQGNPVHWQPWDEQALAAAKAENKLMIISIGYSACHWCHVMEHESFEDDEVARLMNEHFVSIKIDREERPDIDQVYMSAVQLMTGRGGWPLNCIALPDGRPVYGGTYFSKTQWMELLTQLSQLYTKDAGRMREYADKLQQGMKQAEILAPEPMDSFSPEMMQLALDRWKGRMDTVHGGPNKAPKFPLPNNYRFLLTQLTSELSDDLEQHIRLTLDRMCLSGIYDQIGGGFARYSTDAEWKVPHFEKMLYDNAQLIGLYAEAYRIFGESMYRRVAVETLEWSLRELRDPSGLFHSALDADSEGKEGLFYTWSSEEIRSLIADHPDLEVDRWFLLDEGEQWEGRFILQRRGSDQKVKKRHSWTEDVFRKRWTAVRETLLAQREKRIRPGLDFKVLCSWNAQMVSALCTLYEATLDPEHKALAQQTFHALVDQMRTEEGLAHSWAKGSIYGSALLDDHAFLIRAALDVHRISGEEAPFLQAVDWTEEASRLFHDPKSPLLWYSTDENLVVRTKENEDNVIPAANSTMARNYRDLGLLSGKGEWMERAREMTAAVAERFGRYPESYSNWGFLLDAYSHGSYELVIVGPDAEAKYREVLSSAAPGLLLSWTDRPSDLPAFAHRWKEGSTLFFLCEEGACQMPVSSWAEAKEMMAKTQ